MGKGPWWWVRAQGGEGQTDSPHRQSIGEECIERRGKGKEKRKRKKRERQREGKRWGRVAETGLHLQNSRKREQKWADLVS